VERLEQLMSGWVCENHLIQLLTYLTKKEDENFVFVQRVEQNVFYANLFAWEILDLDQTSMGAICQHYYDQGRIHLEEHERRGRFD
jgi:hypothetical protein